jgi:glycerophosphoryl diester phosphodiesterase
LAAWELLGYLGLAALCLLVGSVVVLLGVAAFGAPARAVHTPAVVGHRAHEGPNENTLQALRFDARHHVRFETDTWVLKDGTSVIVHDVNGCRTVDHDTYPAGVPCTTKWRDLTTAQFDVLRTKGDDPQPLPHLEEWIRVAGQLHVRGMIEVKWVPRDPAQVMSWVRAYDAPVTFYGAPHLWNGRCLQTSMTAMRAAGARVGLKASGPCGSSVSVADAATFGYRYIIGPVTAEGVAAAHGYGMRVGNFNSGRPKTWRQLRDLGADFILTPTPLRTKRWLHDHTHPAATLHDTEESHD